MSIEIDIARQLQKQAMSLIALAAIKEMMLAGIPKDVINSIRKKLETEKEELLKNFDQI